MDLVNDSAMEFDVGKRLTEVRVAAGLSQRELAARSGVPHGLISVIERNKSSPSVSSLRKIIGGIPMTLGDFFHESTGNPNQIFFKRSDLTDLAQQMPLALQHQAKIELLQVGDAAAANLQLLFERYQPGADTGETMFQHDSYEGGIVLSGTLELTVGDRVGVLKAGEAYLFNSREPHRFRNAGDDVLELIAACTPPFL
ncbi:cupin domain-containing protein [Agrobacterium vitis]